MEAVVGIPRGLLFYEYYPWYRALLEGLGAEVVVSPDTSKQILDQGVQTAVDEACLPVKMFFGHVSYLKDRVNYLFIPRMVSVCPYEYTCPKLLGLPDMVKAGFTDLPSIIDASLDLSRRVSQVHKFVSNVARALGRSPGLAEASLKKANEVFAKYKQMLRNGVLLPKAMDLIDRGSFSDGPGGLSDDQGSLSNGLTRRVKEGRDTGNLYPEAPRRAESPSDLRTIPKNGEAADCRPLRIAFMGHNYLLFDKQVGLTPMRYLEMLGAEIVTADMVADAQVEEGAGIVPKAMFWSFEKRVFGATIHLIKTRAVDGVIQFVSFACGPDSMVGQLAESVARKYGVPYLQLTVDEHTGEAGIMTRLEAFIDMIRWRQKSGETDLSTYGVFIHPDQGTPYGSWDRGRGTPEAHPKDPLFRS